MNAQGRSGILLVEDEAIIAMNQKLELERRGYVVHLATSGEMAVELAAGTSLIDLVLMDINLGKGIDGPEAAEIILRIRDLPIVFLSSHTEPQVVAKTERISSYGYVVKNSGITVLDASIKMAYRLFEAKRQTLVSATRYLRLFEAAQDGILILDAGTGKIMDVNPYLIGLLGFSKPDFLEKAIWEIGAFHNLAANQENFMELQEKGYIRYENLPLETSKGAPVEVEFVSNVYQEGDHQVIQCNIRSIGTRKAAEAILNFSETRYRRLFETAQDGILLLDAESGKIVDVNPFLIDMLGFSKLEFLEKRIWDIGIFKDLVASRENFLELQRKKYIRYEDLPLETASGGIVQVEFISSVYSVDGHKVIQCTIRNINDRKIAESLISRLLAEKEIILREVHHRIKNNMYTIASLLSLQAESLQNPLAVAALDDAGSRVESMMVLYDKLYQSTSFEAMAVRDFLPALVEKILANFPNRGSVLVEYAIGDVVIDADKLQPFGIIVNELLTNIMKYAFQGRSEGRLGVSASSSGASTRLEIQDDGNGIPEGISFATSTGFGLRLVEMLTRQLRGEIRIERGSGTRVVLEFDGTREARATPVASGAA